MSEAIIHKLVSTVEEVRNVQGRPIDPPLRRVAAVAVLSNPFSGRYSEDLTSLGMLGKTLAEILGRRAIELLGNDRSRVATYGKAALVGLHGELEHGAAVLHPLLGKALRGLIGHATTMMPSVTKVGPAGALLDIPLHSVTDQWSFDHFDSASIAVPDAPTPDELLIAIAMSDRGRPLARTASV
jgi:hypothetical protein